MAVTAITPYQLVKDTGYSWPAGTVAATPADGWAIAAYGRDGRELMLKFTADASGDTVTITAGDNPPALRKGLGDATITLSTSETEVVCVEAARFVQNDGTIIATCVDAGTTCAALIMPK